MGRCGLPNHGLAAIEFRQHADASDHAEAVHVPEIVQASLRVRPVLESDHEIVRIAHDPALALPGPRPPLPVDPQVASCVAGVGTAPCGLPAPLSLSAPSCRTPAFSHPWIRRTSRRSPKRRSTNRTSQSLPTSSKECANVLVHDPACPRELNGAGQRVGLIVRAAPRSEPVAEPEELRLVDRRQDAVHRRL